MFGVDAGTLEQKKGSCWKHFLEHMEAMHAGVCHVATFQRRDVPTSRRWVNQYRSQQSKMSRRLNIATFQRRDVSTGSAPHHLKHQCFRMDGIGRRTNKGKEFQSSSDIDFEEVPVICTVSNFWILG